MSELASDWITASTYMWIDIRSYKDSNGDGVGDVQGLISKLDYLDEIGIGVMMFPGHQPTDFAYGGTMKTEFCDVDPRLGTLEDFDELISEAHKRRMAVVSGWAPYSTHPDHPYFQASRNPSHPEHATYADYYLWTEDLNARIPRRGLKGHWEWDDLRKQYYHTIWKTVDGRRCPETNPYSEKMREENEEVIRFWLERGLDGFWIDVGTGGDFYSIEDHTDFTREMNAIIHSYPNKLSICEGGGSVEETICRDGFDQFWRHLPVHETVFNEDLDVGTFVSGPPGHRHGIHEELIGSYTMPKGNHYCTVYPSVMPMRERYRLLSSKEARDAKVKQFFALALTLPVVPMFIMGTECGLNLLQSETFSQKWDYSPMMWDQSENYGFTTARPFVPTNPDNYPSSLTVENQFADPNSILNCFKKLSNLRKKNPALKANEPVSKSYAKIPTQDDQKYYVFLRYSSNPERRILVVFNLQNIPQQITCDFEKTKHKINERYDVADLYSGEQERTLESNKYTVQLPPNGFKILEIKRK